jgi:stage V sporulation protein SpoVS
VSAKHDNWRDLGTRLAFESCGTGVAMMRGIGAAAVYVMAQAFIHARSIAALRGLDLQATMGWQNVEAETRSEPIHAVIIYAFARKPDQIVWEEFPNG